MERLLPTRPNISGFYLHDGNRVFPILDSIQLIRTKWIQLNVVKHDWSLLYAFYDSHS